MNKKAIQILEFHKIIEQLCSEASSKPGKTLCANLEPMTNLTQIMLAQQETADAYSRIIKFGRLSFRGNHDILRYLHTLEIGSTLHGNELLEIASSLECAQRAIQYAKKENQTISPDSLDDYFGELEGCHSVSEEIRRCLLSEEEFADDASPRLKQLRKNVVLIGERIKSQLSSMVSGSYRTYLQDAVITMRGDRYCIPVKAEYKNQVPGMIHDQSKAGSTYFIEPASIVTLNNELRDTRIEEEREKAIILATLSEMVYEHTQQIATNATLLTQLDYLFAKGSLAISQKASRPHFQEERKILLKKARHPLLDPTKVVPIDIRLGDSFDLLIITGPNTGGKTVSLKTVGLLAMMGQAGLHIPATESSELCIFDDIFADIGDEQSIEQSLSTFSSHMTNIVQILKNATSQSLCLFDELGAGTDPVEGAALAIAILTTLHERGIPSIATTHYSELKIFALETSYVENASCEFDVESLRPTYRLLIGVPGKSNAFAISSKLGLPDSIIERAKSKVSKENESFEDVLSNLESARMQMERDRAEIASLKRETQVLQEKWIQKQERLDAARDKVLREANEKAKIILQDAKEVADDTIRQMQQANTNTSIQDLEKKRTRVRDKIQEKNSQLSLAPSKKETAKAPKPQQLLLGSSVQIPSMGLKGTVSSLPDAKGNLFVQCGIIRTQTNVSSLILMEETPNTTTLKAKGHGIRTSGLNKAATISYELNLLGKKVDEALVELDKYLDDAYLSHMSSARIVHGKGTGALRMAIHSHLKHINYIKSYRLGEYGEGDAGVTIVEFK